MNVETGPTAWAASAAHIRNDPHRHSCIGWFLGSVLITVPVCMDDQLHKQAVRDAVRPAAHAALLPGWKRACYGLAAQCWQGQETLAHTKKKKHDCVSAACSKAAARPHLHSHLFECIVSALLAVVFCTQNMSIIRHVAARGCTMQHPYGAGAHSGSSDLPCTPCKALRAWKSLILCVASVPQPGFFVLVGTLPTAS